MPALLYGMEAWKKLSKAEILNLEKIQGKALKRIFSLPITTPYIGLIIETGVWPAEQRINYSSLMLYHNIEELNIKLEKALIMKKSHWKRTVKDKIQNQIQERVEKEMENKSTLD